VEGDFSARAEELLRLLGQAAGAARLYPATSALPSEAVARFAERGNALSSQGGPLRFIVDPHGFRLGEATLGDGSSTITGIAEQLHALQVGQLIVAPDLIPAECTAFIGVINADPAGIRSAGGVRAALVAAGVSHLAVIEVTLRASEEEGFLGLDLTNAPLEEIAREAAMVAERWALESSSGEGTDDVAEAIGLLEQATRDIAMQRVAAAMLRLDEATRMRILAWSLHPDSAGRRMQGMLDVVSRMKPAALARLLKLVADQAGTEPGRVATAMNLPPEVMEAVALLLRPSPCTEADCGVPSDLDPVRLAEEVADTGDRGELDRQLCLAAPALAAGRALATAVAVSRGHADADSVTAIGEALPLAASDGAFPQVREALRRLDELSADARLGEEVAVARAGLSNPDVLAHVCQAPLSDADAAIAGEILRAAGPAGAEALIECSVHADEPQASLLRPVLRGMGEAVLGVASRRLRTDDPATAIGLISLLPWLGDKRAVPVLAQGLEHLDAEVRLAAVTALADMSGPEASAALARAVTHWDPETQRWAVREIGRVGDTAALPALLRQLEDINPFARSHDLKKEIITALEEIGSPDALPALKRLAAQPIPLGRRRKELRVLARRAVNTLTRTAPTQGAQ